MTWVYRGNAASHVVGFCIWTSISDLKFLKRNRIVSIYLTFERKPILKKKFGFSSSFSHFSFFFSNLLLSLYSPPLFCFLLHFAIDKEILLTTTKKEKKRKKKGNQYSQSLSKSLFFISILSSKDHSILSDHPTKRQTR